MQEKEIRTVWEIVKRAFVLIFGLVVMAFGVAFSINADLGTSPVSSIPYVTSLISGLTVGTTTIIVNTVIVLLQIVVLRRHFRLIRLLQIPVCVAFGLLIDLASYCIADVIPQGYLMQWLLCAVGIVLVAIGVSCEVAADLLTLAGEGLVQALCAVCPIKFGYMKVIVDVSFVVIAVVLSFAFLHELQACARERLRRQSLSGCSLSCSANFSTRFAANCMPSVSKYILNCSCVFPLRREFFSARKAFGNPEISLDFSLFLSLNSIK